MIKDFQRSPMLFFFHEQYSNKKYFNFVACCEILCSSTMLPKLELHENVIEQC